MMSWSRKLPLVAALFLAGLTLGCQSPAAQTASSASPAVSASPASPTPLQVSALARLEPEGKILHLQAPAPRQQDRIQTLLIKEGQRVRKGQLLARLDGARRLEDDLRVAEARVAQAQARLGQVLAGPKSGEVLRQQGELRRLELERHRQEQVQRTLLSRLEVEEAQARRNFERYRSLYQDGACSAYEMEQRQTLWESSQRQVEQARRELKRILDTLAAQAESARGELRRIEEIRPADVAAAEADVEQARTEVERIRGDLKECQLMAPQDGVILKIHARQGERIGSNGFADLADTRAMVAVAEVHQNDLARLRVHQSCTLTSPAIKGTLRGRVERFEQQVQRQNIFSAQPGEQFDQRIVEVRIALDAESTPIAANWTNLQLDAVFAAE